ncbi:sensor histidine kinase [Buchananella hordeovulneris]|nr:sensor histidine kinase [Buchananella hordeovulneris]
MDRASLLGRDPVVQGRVMDRQPCSPNPAPPGRGDAGASPPPVVPLSVSLGLLAGAASAALFLTYLGAAIAPPWLVPWLALVTGVLAVLRWGWSRAEPGGAAARACYWGNICVCVPAQLLSPCFGIYLFLSYYEAQALPGRREQVAGTVATAAAISVATAGGWFSWLFQPGFYLAFFVINLVISLSMRQVELRQRQLVASLAAANKELRREQERSARLTAQLVAGARQAGVSEERARLSREIHDTVAQDLVAIIAQLEVLHDERDQDRTARLAVVSATARSALSEARRAVAALASARLDDADLPLALDDLLAQWRARTGLAAELTVAGRRRPHAGDATLMRVAQEALANVARHARARRVQVALEYGAGVRLVVRDDGVGLGPQAVPGYGLRGLRERVAQHGGRLRVENRPTGGVELVADLPERTQG